MSTMLIFALHIRNDGKTTVVNDITWNLFLQQSKKSIIDKGLTLSSGANRNHLLANPIHSNLNHIIILS